MAMGDELMTIFLANWIWKLDILPRIQTFVWMCAHNSIGVRECLGKGDCWKIQTVHYVIGRLNQSCMPSWIAKRSNLSGFSWGFYGHTLFFGPGTSMSGWNLMGKKLIVSVLEILLGVLSSSLLFGLYEKVETTWFLKGEVKTQHWQ